MVRGIILGLLTLGIAVIVLRGMIAFVGDADGWEFFAKWGVSIAGLFLIVWLLQRAGIIDRHAGD
jgi:hypothetical protein